eukprot:s2509_g10.t1
MEEPADALDGCSHDPKRGKSMGLDHLNDLNVSQALFSGQTRMGGNLTTPECNSRSMSKRFIGLALCPLHTLSSRPMGEISRGMKVRAVST